MNNKIRYVLVGILVVMMLGSLTLGSISYYYVNYSQEDYTTFDEAAWTNPLDDEGIADNAGLYSAESPEVSQIYVTILPRQEKGMTFDEMIRANDSTGETDIQLEVYMETEDKKLLDNGLYTKEPNATLEIKGASSQKAPTKSFKIKLGDKAGLWKGQDVINLNKDYFDAVRIRNKLAYDSIARLEDITSFQTSFVRLFIRDLSEEQEEATFEDYGFFTHVEQPNKMYLKNHLLDPSGQLYLAENFNFARYQENLMMKDHPNYSKKQFEEVLEIKGDDNHTKLIEMLEAVNDESQPIGQTVEKYFDEENYLTWLATNILLGNDQVSHENFLIYSPLNTAKWFFIPYDFNQALGSNTNKPKWQKGIGMYWDNVLHRRYLSESENVEALTTKLEEISKIITQESMQQLLDSYYEIVMANLTRMPDFGYLILEFEELLATYQALPEQLEINKQNYYQSLQAPMPFKIEEVHYQDKKLTVQWEEAIDLFKEPITYTIQLASDEAFEKIIYEKDGLKETNCTITPIEAGTYYLKITAYNQQGNSQNTYSMHKDYKGDKLFGIEKIHIK